MLDFKDLAGMSSWYKEPGPSYDVVLSSRIRFSRNLAGFPFPGRLERRRETEVQRKFEEAFQIPELSRYSFLHLGELTPTRRRLLIERNLISQEYSLEKDRGVLLRDDEKISAVFNEKDHVRLSAFGGGLSVRDLFQELSTVDQILEKRNPYSVNLDFGYLSADLGNLGCGMKASVMVHLPGLVRMNMMDKAVRAVMKLGLSVRGFFGEGEDSLGDLYQISTDQTLGSTEAEILEKLDGLALQLVNYEKKARETLSTSQILDLEDAVGRAYGICRHCRRLASNEAMELLSTLRLGVSLKLTDCITLEEATGLFFLVQKYHMNALLGRENREADAAEIDAERARLVRESLRDSAK